MLIYMLTTNKYKHEYTFKFKNVKYHVHSIVYLTDEGKHYLNSRTNEAILTEVFINWNGNRCWKYEFRSGKRFGGITNASTDIPPDKLIEEVMSPASGDYMLREVCGPEWNASSGVKHTKKDLEIPEVRNGWIIFILVSFGAFIFKDWYITLIIQLIAACYFLIYRKMYIDANTVYTHTKDTEMLKKKYEVLYGLKNSEENKDNE